MAIKDLKASVSFGRPMRDAHFLLAPTYSPLNHGAYGTYPKAVQKRLRHCQDLSEARPDASRHNDIPRMLDQNRAAIASYLHLPVDEIVLVPNASTASNTVLRSLAFDEGDAVVHLSTVYVAVEKTLEYLKETTPVATVKIEVEYPISDDGLVERFRHGISNAKSDGKRVRLAVFDTISSVPGALVPWERLVAVCKAEGVLSFVDGAHGAGNIELDLSKSQPDFFASNLHKWLFVPRFCAVFYVPKRNQHLIRSAVPTSYRLELLSQEGILQKTHDPLPTGAKSPFVLMFELVATIDVSPYLCIEEALQFRNEACGGEKKIMEYCRFILDDAGMRAAEFFGTEIMENAEGPQNRSAFCNVRLPLKLGTSIEEVPEHDAVKVAIWIAQQLIQEYDTFAPVYVHAGSFWTRFSGQIYLEPEDFDKGARAIKQLCTRVQSGAYRLDAVH